MYLLVIILAIIIYQDLKERAISWWTIPLLLLSIIYIRMGEESWNELLLEGVLNVFFIVLQLVLISIYFSIKQRRLVNIADTYLGWGDILFLLPLAFLFPTISFIVFYVSSILIVLIGFLLYKTFLDKKVETIPLAGGQAMYLMLFLFFSKVFDFSIESYLFPSLF